MCAGGFCGHSFKNRYDDLISCNVKIRLIPNVTALFTNAAAMPSIGELAHFLIQKKKIALKCFQIVREDTSGYTFSVTGFIYSKKKILTMFTHGNNLSVLMTPMSKHCIC